MDIGSHPHWINDRSAFTEALIDQKYNFVKVIRIIYFYLLTVNMSLPVSGIGAISSLKVEI